MTTIARNMAIDYLRKYRKEEMSDTLEEIEQAASPGQGSGWESPADQKERR